MYQMAEEPARIVAAATGKEAVEKIRSMLTEDGQRMIESSFDGDDCLRKIRLLRPDLLIIDYDLMPRNGYEIALIAMEDGLCDTLLLLNPDQRDNVLRENEAGQQNRDIVTALKPISKERLSEIVELVLRSRRKAAKLEKEIESLRNELRTRKEVEKAKGRLMSALKLTEERAFRLIQSQSMNRGMPMADVAKVINDAFDADRAANIIKGLKQAR